jgi:mannosyltransferase OCH1-like enzyme
MEQLNFDDLDKYLISQNGKIIHQIWFGLIPNKRKAKKDFQKLKKYRDSWLIKNPGWAYFCWNYENCENLIKTLFPEHQDMYKKYTYLVQKCDAIRYFILYRYGGIYADMDYFCNKPFDEALSIYKNDMYLVETPNKMENNVHVSNSLMYSKPNHPFWKSLFIELELNKVAPYYYSKHLIVMTTTGPNILNKVFHQYKHKYKLGYFPQKLFHPYGLTDEIITLNNKPDIYAMHLGKGSWENDDSKFLIFLYLEYKFLLFIVLLLVIPNMFLKWWIKSK